jgi:RHS repeat-associated protein
VGAKASVTLLFVALGLHEPVSPAWAKKDRVEVTLTAPAAGALYNAPAAIRLSAIARTKQKNHPIAKVEFFQGTKLIGTVAGPRRSDRYRFIWTGVPAGQYAVSAKATNNKGETDLSEPVSLTVNALPSVSITAPGNNAILTAPATFTVTASASDSDGSIARVEFYKGATLIGTATNAPYGVTLSDAAAGLLRLTAIAIDNRGASSTSAPVAVIVNSLPSVLLTSPSSNAAFKAPASIPLAVQVADTDGSIANVEYFYGTTLITSLSAPPYSFVWTEVPQGTYALTARVTDNLGGVMTSVAVNVTVNAAEAKLYYIHVDHLNTPRLIADDQLQTVWRWDQQEPFGVNVPDENPSGLGVFELPLRLPGQYHDQETTLQYNMFRDYDPSLGRYGESDPGGLRAGLNTYAYVGGTPLTRTDPLGLAYFGYRSLQGLPFGFMLVSALLGTYNVAHEQLFFEDGLSPPNLGYGPNGLFTEPMPIGYTRSRSGYDDCIMRIAVGSTPLPPSYNFVCRNCQKWASDVRGQYAILASDPAIQELCKCKTPAQSATSSAISVNQNAALGAAAATAAAAALLLLAF